MKLPKKLIFVLILFIFKSIGRALLKSIVDLVTGKSKKTPSKAGAFGSTSSKASELPQNHQEQFARYHIHPVSPKDINSKPVIDGDAR